MSSTARTATERSRCRRPVMDPTIRLQKCLAPEWVRIKRHHPRLPDIGTGILVTVRHPSPQGLRMDLACTAMAFLLPTFGKRPQDQEGASRKRATPTPPATEQEAGRPGATQHIAHEPDAVAEHIALASLGSTCEASPGSGDMTIESLADVVSKLASECDESAVALCGAARTLQRGMQAEVRNLCKPWGVQMGSRIDGKYKRRDLDVLKSELTATFIEKAKEHFRTKATEPVRRFPCSDIRRWMPNLKTNQISSLATPAPKETKYADIASFVVKAPLI